ncbi:hypothetical protein SCHPADRAFT_752166 [Schizopora paradoxa]|uniref:Uncharacterized protein n=1 Tax=Schizopora paradoxa TaxID=27342 RepID=A0A0H2QZS7_9AGAM|nr:hypothetical protein SCHPADRAFT_752166 [Schizopora paradoxa]
MEKPAAKARGHMTERTPTSDTDMVEVKIGFTTNSPIRPELQFSLQAYANNSFSFFILFLSLMTSHSFTRPRPYIPFLPWLCYY